MYHILKQLEIVAFTIVPVQHRTPDINLGLKIHIYFSASATLHLDFNPHQLCLKFNKDTFQSTGGERLLKGCTQGKIGETTHHYGSK